LSRAAAEAGVNEAWRIFSLTPRETALLIARHRAGAAAGLYLARLVALAVHAPERLPIPPPPPMRDMTADEIKQRLLAWRGKDDAP